MALPLRAGWLVRHRALERLIDLLGGEKFRHRDGSGAASISRDRQRRCRFIIGQIEDRVGIYLAERVLIALHVDACARV